MKPYTPVHRQNFIHSSRVAKKRAEYVMI